ncbi:MAG: amino acid adenylation domain-containing protein, partial [Vicinamibacterales bacterium]
AQVERTPDRLAVVDEQRGWTYSELNDAAARVAAALTRRGVGAESLVGIYAHRSVAMVAALLGTQKARAAFLPLDPAYPPERLRFMLDDAKAAVIITDRRLCETLPAAAGAGTLVLDDLDAEATPSPAGEPVAAHPRHLAYVLYTSGSTGRPKGIAIEQGSAVAFMQWARATYDDAALTGVLATTSISYDCAIFEIFAPLCWGGKVILAASAMQLPADAGHATLASMLPSTLLAHLRAETLPRSLRAINVGGEFSPKDLCGELNRRQTSQLIYHVYGPAEDTTYSTFSLMRGDEASLVSIGKPLLGKAAYVLDADGSPAPIGVPGELHLSGLGLARGYRGKPDLSADRFIPNPFSAQPGARMYRTGDLARIRPDGELELLGRLDRQIKLRGARIEAREIEAVLEEHPAVEDAVVIAVQDATDETRLVAYVVAQRDQAPPDRATLRLFAKTRLPAAIVPSQFVFLREFVRMPNGKIDLRALPEPPPWQADARDNRRMAPRDDVELQLAQAWEELLGTSPVGVQDDFFELGGHSLKALALVSRIQRTFGRRIPFSALLDRGTVERLADLVRGGNGAAAQASLVKIKAGGSRPPLFLVHPGRGSVFCYYELAQHLSRDFDVYGLQCRGLDGQLPPHRTIEEMATDYLRELDGRAAGQPFVIAGWCMGGLIAFEMARQWRTTGRGAPALAILDSDAPTWPEASQPADDDVALLTTFAEHLNLAWGASAPSLEELRTLPADRVLATVLERAKKANAVPTGVSLAEAQLLFDLFKANCRAERDYTPSAYEGDVLLFRAVESIGGEVLEPDLGWAPFAGAGRLRVRDVPGNHHTMLHEPHVAALAGEVLGAVNAYAESSPSM